MSLKGHTILSISFAAIRRIPVLHTKFETASQRIGTLLTTQLFKGVSLSNLALFKDKTF
jgi:hypothetical protein